MRVLILESNRLRLRPWGRGDLDDVVAMDSDASVFEYSQLSQATAGRYLQKNKLRHEIHRQISSSSAGEFWVIEWNRRPGFLGLIGLAPRLTEAQLSYRLAVSNWGQGIATEAAMTLCNHFARKQTFSAITAVCHRNNMRSRRVLEKIGMEANGIVVPRPNLTLMQKERWATGVMNLHFNSEHWYINFNLNVSKILQS